MFVSVLFDGACAVDTYRDFGCGQIKVLTVDSTKVESKYQVKFIHRASYKYLTRLSVTSAGRY